MNCCDRLLFWSELVTFQLLGDVVGMEPIVIVGAGLAGLSCAVPLHRNGREVLLLEASSRVGGRVQTDAVEDSFSIEVSKFIWMPIQKLVRCLIWQLWILERLSQEHSCLMVQNSAE